jgi:hypothetical protein
MPILQPDYRIFEMNKRLQQRTEESDNLWWDAFATEFFEDEAQLTLTFCLEDGPKRYCEFHTLFSFFVFFSFLRGGGPILDLHILKKKLKVCAFDLNGRKRVISG